MLKLKKPIKIVFISFLSLITLFVLAIVLFILFINPIAHWAIEKYSPEYTGRQVLLRDIHIGLLTGKFSTNGVYILEPNHKDTLAYTGDLFVKFSLSKAIRGVYKIDTVGIDTLIFNINQNRGKFNFDDLLTRFLAPSVDDTLPSMDTVKYFVNNISLRNARIRYKTAQPDVTLLLHQTQTFIPEFAYNNPWIKIDASSLINQKGSAHLKMEYNLNTMAYQMEIETDSISTIPLFPYVSPFVNSSRADGLISGRMTVSGNFNTPTKLSLSGDLHFSDFVMTDSNNEKVVGWKDFAITIDSVNTITNKYVFNEINIKNPYTLVVLTPKGNNIQDLVKMGSSSVAADPADNRTGTPIDYANPFIMLGTLIRDIAQQYSRNEYGVNKFAIENGTVIYHDFLTGEKFSIFFDEFNASSQKFTDKSKSINFKIHTLMNRYGNVNASLSIDNQNYRDFDLDLKISSLTMSIFNPYTKYYVAYPFWRGDITFMNQTSVRGDYIDSKNRLIVKQIKIGDRIKNDSAFKIPMKLAIAILRDRHGNIDIEIPVDGNMKDPNYHWGRAAWKIFKNLVVKAVTSPFTWLAKAINGDPELLKSVEFNPMQMDIQPDQARNLNAIGKTLQEKQEMVTEFSFRNNLSLEQDAISAQLALSKWYFEKAKRKQPVFLSKEQSDTINALSVYDSTFQDWLTKRTGLTSLAIALPEKCKAAVGGETVVNQELSRINGLRDKAIADFLYQKYAIEPKRIKFIRNSDDAANKNTPRPIYDVKFSVLNEPELNQ